MKSSRTKSSVPPANAAVQPTISSSRSAAALSSSSLPSPAASTFSATLRSNPQSSVYHLRTRLNPSGATGPTGRRSPLKSELLTTKSSKRTYPLPVNTNSSASRCDSGNKSMKKHFLSKSNDSLSGERISTVKKSKSQPVAVQSRGIRHPAVNVSVLRHKSPQPTDKPVLNKLLLDEAEDHCADLIRTDRSSNNGDAQEMRRSVSSNCLDVGNVVSRNDQRRLSIPDVNRINVATNGTMPTISLLNTNFALPPSQPGVTLVSAGTQTENNDVIDAGQSSSRRSFNSEMNLEFEDLLQEHSAISRQLSDLCKVEEVSGMMDEEMGENEGGLSRNLDWDSQSNNSLCSEPSLAGLQDRIHLMEETHHSTYEELQATLQELAEMGDLVTVYKKENEELLHEKNVLQETLCAMTEKVHVYQTQTESLKKMLYRQAAGDENSSPDGMEAVNEKEKTLVELMKNLQDEKDEIHHQLDTALEQNTKLIHEVEDTQAKLHHLDHWCDEVEKEKKDTEDILASTRESLRKQELEVNRLSSLLENEKAKTSEVHVSKNSTSDASDLLNHLAKEKDRLLQQFGDAENRIRHLEEEVQNQKEAFRIAEEKRNAREKDLTAAAQEYAQRLNIRENDCKNMEADIARMKKDCEELERSARLLEQTRNDIQEQFMGLQTEFTKEQREWNHFQDDLLTAVRVANDFRTDCELKTKTVVEENQQLKRKIDDLTGELERLKTKKPLPSPLKMLTSETADVRSRLDPLPLRSPIERESVSSRLVRTPSQSVSVKSIVQNMESNTLGARQGSPRLAGLVSKAVGIRKRDENVGHSESNSSLDSTDKTLDFDKSMDDEPSVPGDGLKPILSNKPRNSLSGEAKSDKRDLMFDALGNLAKGKGSKRNALLKFCQEKTLGYSGIDVTNFSSSWNDGLAFCALLHSYCPDRIPYKELDNKDKRRNFTLAFEAAKSAGIPQTLEINDLLSDDRPDWRGVMDYVIAIYQHFEM